METEVDEDNFKVKYQEPQVYEQINHKYNNKWSCCLKTCEEKLLKLKDHCWIWNQCDVEVDKTSVEDSTDILHSINDSRFWKIMDMKARIPNVLRNWNFRIWIMGYIWLLSLWSQWSFHQLTKKSFMF